MTRKIGGGGFGEIYEGIDLVTKEQVMIIIVLIFIIIIIIIIIILILWLMIIMLIPYNDSVRDEKEKVAMENSFATFILV